MMLKHAPRLSRRVLVVAATLAVPLGVNAQSWTGGGAADTSWGNADNWSTAPVLPAFDGTDSLSVTGGFGPNTALTLGADRSISRLTFGGGGTAISLSGNTLTLTKTDSTAVAGNAVWNANTNDGTAATVNSNLLMQSGAAGSYTAHFRENNNSNGGTRFNGVISQGTDENWTLAFSRSSARGAFFLNNAANSFGALTNQNAEVWSQVPGSFGSGLITLSGGITGTQTTPHFATPISNNITLTSTAAWESRGATRMTGSLTQGGQTLNYGSSSSNFGLTRLEYAGVTGTGTTSLRGGAVAPSAMNQFTTGTLNLGDGTQGAGVLVLSGAGTHGVPQWSDFIAARTFNQSGGPGTWRINVNAGSGANTTHGGGFAARGADLVIPHQSAPNAGGITNATFTRNFVLGSVAMVDGDRYANNAVIINTDIAYGAVAGDRRYFVVSPNLEVSTSTTNWTLGGPVHELAGVVSGENVIIYPLGLNNGTTGLVRISNADNALTGTSRWVIGGSRGTFTTLGGGSIAGPGNMGDLSSATLIFTSDGAFGGASEVEVASRGSSGTATAGMLLLENASGPSTTFSRNFNVVATAVTQGAAAWGSYAGNVIYQGTVTYAGSGTGTGSAPIHVQAGSLTLDGATFVNNRTLATTYHKGGPGELIIDGLTISGTQATNNWNVQQGRLTVNSVLPTGDVIVSNGGVLGGVGAVSGAVTAQSGGIVAPGNSIGTFTVGALTLQAGATLEIEVSNVASDLLVVGGNLNLNANNDTLALVSFSGGPSGSVPSYTILSYASRNGDFNVVSVDSTPVSLTDAFDPLVGVSFGSGVYYLQWNDAGGTLLLNAVPEPASLSVLALAGLMLRRRRA